MHNNAGEILFPKQFTRNIEVYLLGYQKEIEYVTKEIEYMLEIKSWKDSMTRHNEVQRFSRWYSLCENKKAKC